MKFTIRHEIRGRIRISLFMKAVTYSQADKLEYYLCMQEGVKRVKVYERTADVVVYYEKMRTDILKNIQGFSFDSEELRSIEPVHTGRELNAAYKEKLIDKVALRTLSKVLLPLPLRTVWITVKAARYLLEGLKCLWNREVKVAVLDATAITASVLRQDYNTAGSIMFLLEIGELLEEWTHKKSVNDLARSMSLNVSKVWLKTKEQDVLAPVSEIKERDVIVVHMGNVIPVDGVVVNGDGAVNQASLTGEPLAVHKTVSSYVYAGTVLEEGQLQIEVRAAIGKTRYEKIVQIIEDSERLKSEVEGKAEHLADRLVPWSLGATAFTYLATGNITKALSILMVDFSCALKLSMPLSVLSAMRESSQNRITVKGGKFLEAVAQADTLVFDKTGTLTKAQPSVVTIVPFHGTKETEMLRVAACLEEHFPHSMANAVVREAVVRGIEHGEMHTKVEYVVAHGISSHIEDKRVVIGSSHFVFEDEGCVIPEEEKEKFEALPDEYSHLYLAIDGILSAVICIEDPIRKEAEETIRLLHEAGIKKIVMMTGDSERTARSVAAKTGVDLYYSEVLPEDKAEFVEREKTMGHTVIMVGDGINDSPALSAADAGIAISDGAEIAREIADITIAANDLRELVKLKKISDRLMERIHSNYRFVISFNLGLIVLGVAGILPPATSALLHNASTLGIGVKSMKNLLEQE